MASAPGDETRAHEACAQRVQEERASIVSAAARTRGRTLSDRAWAAARGERPGRHAGEVCCWLRDVPDAEIHLLDGGHFLLEEHAATVAPIVLQIMRTRTRVGPAAPPKDPKRGRLPTK